MSGRRAREITLDCPQQLLQQVYVKRLGQNPHIDVARPVEFFRITGNENDRQPGFESKYCFGQIDAVRGARHMNVGQHQVERQRLAGARLTRVRVFEQA